MKAQNWTPDENRALVALYFDMLNLALLGKPYSKAAMIRDAIGPVPGLEAPLVRKHHRPYFSSLCNRTKGSIEFKLMNASAAHLDILTAQHRPPIADSVARANVSATMHNHGYRCQGNYQASLKVVIQEALT